MTEKTKDPTLVYEIPIVQPIDNSVRPTICFATMCKNEAHCIRETFESVYKLIDYWIVCDTGSTDDTLTVIQDFFNEKGIPGILYQDEWKGFDHNKTMLFQRCFNNPCDYILHVDADDLIVGDFSFTKQDAGKDQYLFSNKRGSSDYKAVVLWKSDRMWKWCGVAHTIVKCLNPSKEGVTQGDLSSRPFHLISRDTGDRSNDPDKYYKDALRLRDQFFGTLIDDPDGLNSRSVFYTAQSYYDSHRWEEAMQWYSLYTKLKRTWFEEVYESFMRIGLSMQRSGNMTSPKIVESFQNAIQIIPERAEAYFHLGHYYNKVRNWEQGYQFLKEAYSKDHAYCKQKYVLFINRGCYGFHVCDELSVSCFWTKRKKEGMEYLSKLIGHPDFAERQERLKRNMQFFEQLKVEEEPSVPKPQVEPETKKVITRTLAEVQAEVEEEIRKAKLLKENQDQTHARARAEAIAQAQAQAQAAQVQAAQAQAAQAQAAQDQAQAMAMARAAQVQAAQAQAAQDQAQAMAMAQAAQGRATEVADSVPKMRFIN